jgi:hypothetical protein
MSESQTDAAQRIADELRALLKLNGAWERGTAYISVDFVRSYDEIRDRAKAALRDFEATR